MPGRTGGPQQRRLGAGAVEQVEQPGAGRVGELEDHGPARVGAELKRCGSRQSRRTAGSRTGRRAVMAGHGASWCHRACAGRARCPQASRPELSGQSAATRRPVHRPDRAADSSGQAGVRTVVGGGLGLAQDAVHGGAADRALALGHVHAGLADLDRALEVTLLLALHAVAVVRLGLCGHGVLLRGSFACGECAASRPSLTRRARRFLIA